MKANCILEKNFFVWQIIFFHMLFFDCWGIQASFNEQDDFIYDNSVVYENRRFRVSKTKLNYSQATQRCKNDNSNLAEIDSAELTRLINNTLENSNLHRGATKLNQSLTDQSIWIGLQLNITNKSLGYWVNGQAYDSHTSYANWAPGEPKTDMCVQLWKSSYWEWDDTYCDLDRYYICEDQDPESYSASQVSKVERSVLELDNDKFASENDLNLLSLHVNVILDASKTIRHNKTEKTESITSRSILLAIENIMSHFNATGQNYAINRENFAIDIRGLLYQEDDITIGDSQQADVTAKTSGASTSSIILSRALLHEAREKSLSKHVQVNSVLYRKTYLFRTASENETAPSMIGEGPVRQRKSSVLGNVISVDLNNLEMANLRSPVLVNHVVSISDLGQSKYNFSDVIPSANSSRTSVLRSEYFETIRRDVSIKCVFWDFSINEKTGGWSEKGCWLNQLEVTDEIINATCLCDHMTNFGIILDTSEYYEPKYLTYVTISGCIVSVTCLICTLVTHLYFKNLRSQVSKQILIHICIGLILLNGVFLLGIDQTSNAELCFTITIILHYVLLVSWSWMLVMGIFLFRTFVLYKNGSGTGASFMRSASFLSYVAPGLVVAIIASLFRNVYQSERYCWLSGNVLLYSAVIPIALVLFINTMIFFAVMWKIKSTAKSQRFQKQLDGKKLVQLLRRAIFMTLVLGMPWIFGYIMLLVKEENLRVIFATIFTVANSLQGIGIFFLYCLRQEDVRKHYRNTVRSWRRSAGPPRGYRKTTPSETQQTSEDKAPKKSTSTECNLSTLSPSYDNPSCSVFDANSNNYVDFPGLIETFDDEVNSSIHRFRLR